MFESAMADTPQPRKPMTPLRTAEQLDTDEPLDRSHFAVYEGTMVVVQRETDLVQITEKNNHDNDNR